ncbi:hypothetical protein D3C79_649500 [compost metagenome]
MLADSVELGAQAGQRCAQVVGDVVTDAFDFMHQALDAVEHGVDDGREHVQFIPSRRQWQALGQVASDDLFGRGLDRADALEWPAAQEVPASDAGDNGQ